MRATLVYAFLLLIKGLSRLFYRFEVEWIGERPHWDDVRIGALLNHTSLFEPVLAGSLPNGFLKKLAYDGAVPIADVTLKRPLAGALFRSIAGQVIEITRKRDASWDKVLQSIRPGSMVVIMPEGRMMRRGGLDKTGKPMTVRGGIADLIRASDDDGLLVLGYSGGLHHVQAPGDKLPRLFKTIRINYESLDIAAYREGLAEGNGHKRSFKRKVITDLERRRDLHCPATEETGKPIRVEDFDGEVPRDQPLPGM
jgi:hypothetical protein